MNPKQVADLKPGDSILSFFIVRKKEVKEHRRNKELYITFDLGDSSGRIRGSVWDHVQEVNERVNVHDIVKVKGKIITYRDKPHLTIEKIRVSTSKDKINSSQFLPASDHDLPDLYERLLQYIQHIKDPQLHQLAMLIFGDPEFADKFQVSSAAKLWHHNYAGGLLVHTLSLVEMCIFLSTQFKLNQDLLVTAALLHDIGKLKELSSNGYFDYSTEGRLLGHITIGIQLLNEKISEIDNFPEETKLQLFHCILSHHGSLEHGSPVVPMTREAMVLHYADELDSKLGAFDRIEKKEKTSGKEWSEYVNLLDRFLYFGDNKK